jgi:hypothetical protein
LLRTSSVDCTRSKRRKRQSTRALCESLHSRRKWRLCPRRSSLPRRRIPQNGARWSIYIWNNWSLLPRHIVI